MIEVRYAKSEDDIDLDEVVVNGDVVAVHLERMADNAFSLIIHTRREVLNLTIGAKRSTVSAEVFDRSQINRRSEGQMLRWKRWRDLPLNQRPKRQ